MRQHIMLKTLTALLLVNASVAWSQTSVSTATHRPFAANVILPQARAWRLDARPTAGPPTVPGVVQIVEVEVGVVVVEQIATTTMDIHLSNPSGSRQEAELIVPVPDGAVLRSLAFEGTAAEPTAQLLPKDEARAIYDSLVARVRDPALVEFIEYNLIRTSVFPVEANGRQKVRLTYERLLAAEGDRIDYLLPRSENLEYSVPWKVTVQIRSKRPISTVYSPSHRIETIQRRPDVVSVRIAQSAWTEPGAFRLSYLLDRDGLSASLLAYPDAKNGGGYFLLLAGLPARTTGADDVPAIKREVTLVIDRSGSMNGEKITQALEAARQIVAGLNDGETFNILAYNNTVESFSPRPVVKTAETARRAREYINAIQARGGTNLYDALAEALRPEPAEDMLPLVLFLTDGLPTVGQTSEVAIRDLAIKANPHERRVFTFGVGADVNSPLLERIANETRAAPTFVLPGEDVEVKVAGVFKRLEGPVLADVSLDTGDGGSRVTDLVPSRLADLFEDDQLILLGRYIGDEPLTFRVAGNYLGRKRSFTFHFDLDHATTRNAFVPRLWASRKIAVLIDDIRQLGADPSPATVHPTAARPVDPRVKELVDEIVRLSTEFGILTEYTAFLAREGTDLSNRSEVLAQASFNFRERAMNTRSGMGSVQQSFNNSAQLRQTEQNMRNSYLDEQMNRVAIANVQQVNDQAFYNRSGRWIDSRLVQNEQEVQPQRTIDFGSPEFMELARKLASEGRQGTVSLRGDILMLVDGSPVLVKATE